MPHRQTAIKPFRVSARVQALGSRLRGVLLSMLQWERVNGNDGEAGMQEREAQEWRLEECRQSGVMLGWRARRRAAQ